MTLLITIGSPHSAAASVGELLGQAGVPAPRDASGANPSPQMLDSRLAADTAARLLIVYSDPSSELLRSFRDAKGAAASANAVLDSWWQWNDALLRYHFRHRDRSLLVNGEAALAHPGKLLPLLANAGVNGLSTPADEHASTPAAADKMLLLAAEAVVRGRGDVQRLLLELEEAAQLQGGSNAHGAAKPEALWAEACGLVHDTKSRTDALERDAQNSKQQIAQEREAAAGAARSIEALREQVSSARSSLEELSGTCEMLRAECVRASSLAAEREQLANERFTYIGTLEARVAELQALIEDRRASHELEQRLRHQTAELGEARGALAALREDKELLELQLRQVQEELTHYFQAWKDERARSAPDAVADILGRFWKSQQPQILALDLRRPIAGEQWYDAEPDGRWSGPAAESTLQLPPVQAGRYVLEMDVMDAMDNAIVADAQVEIQGRRHSLSIEYFGGEGRFPALCAAPIEIQRSAAAEPLLLKLHLPRTISPRSSGGEDERELGLRLQHVRLIREDAA
jgi:hypothetical protein